MPQQSPWTVKALRQLVRAKVSVTHRRRYWDRFNNRWVFLSKYERTQSNIPFYVEAHPKGGTTTVVINYPGDCATYVGVAECSKHDNYSRKIGVTMALSRMQIQNMVY